MSKENAVCHPFMNLTFVVIFFLLLFISITSLDQKVYASSDLEMASGGLEEIAMSALVAPLMDGDPDIAATTAIAMVSALQKVFASRITSLEVSKHGISINFATGIASVVLGTTMSLNLLTLSDRTKGFLAIFGTMPLATNSVFETLQYQKYTDFFRSDTGGSKIPTVARVVVSTLLGAGIAGADADSGGLALSGFCGSEDSKKGEIAFSPYANNCTDEEHPGYYSGCNLDASSNSTKPDLSSCKKPLYVIGVIAAGIPTGVLGAATMFSSMGTIFDMFENLKLAALAVKDGEPNYIPVENQVIETFNNDYGKQLLDSAPELISSSVAVAIKGAYDYSQRVNLLRYINSNDVTTLYASSTAVVGVALGLGKIALMVGATSLGIAALSDAFNAGKITTYAKENDFQFFYVNRTSENSTNLRSREGGYVVAFPDGTIVDPYALDFVHNETFTDSFSGNMEAVTRAATLSTVTYTLQSVMVSLGGLIIPLANARILYAYVQDQRSDKPVPTSAYLVSSYLVSFAITITGGGFYFSNLVNPTCEKLTAYRKATGTNVFSDEIPANVRIAAAITLLSGLFTVGGARAIQPFMQLMITSMMSRFRKH